MKEVLTVLSALCVFAHGPGTFIMASLSHLASTSPRDPDASPGVAELPGSAQ